MLGWPAYPTYLEAGLLAARAISPRGGGVISSVFLADTLDVASPRRLVVLNTTGFETGTLAFVQSLQAFFYFNRALTLAADNINVANSLIGGGQWIRIEGGARTWQSQAAWFIDPVAGNDENDGATLTPIRTIGEWQRRIGRGGTILATSVVTIRATLPAADAFSPSFSVATAVQVTFRGIPVQVDTGSFTAVVNQNRATQTPYSITDGSKAAAYWAAHVGQRLLLVNGGIAWVALNLGASSARVSRWLIPPTGIGTLPGTGFSPIGGNTYILQTLPSITVGEINIKQAGQGIAGSVVFEALDIVGTLGTIRGDQGFVIFSGCSIAQISYNSTGIFLCACHHSGGVIIDGDAIFIAGLVRTTNLRVEAGGNVTLDFDTYAQSVGLCRIISNGHASVVFAACFDAASGDTAFVVEGGRATQEEGFSGAGLHLLWGTGNASHGLTVRSTSNYVYKNGIKPTINSGLGVGRETSIGGTDVLYVAIPFIEPANNAAIVSFA